MPGLERSSFANPVSIASFPPVTICVAIVERPPDAGKMASTGTAGHCSRGLRSFLSDSAYLLNLLFEGGPEGFGQCYFADLRYPKAPHLLDVFATASTVCQRRDEFVPAEAVARGMRGPDAVCQFVILEVREFVAGSLLCLDLNEVIQLLRIRALHALVLEGLLDLLE
jgi:hypothetical protein